MLRESIIFLGRWKHTDFMKGRTKRQGAVHTKSTLGGAGNYRAYYKKYGARDGPHNEFNMNGRELGVRLFGGFHGNRMPLDDLAFYEKDTLELSIYGHDSITNPFRGMLSRHPHLDSLVAGPAGRAVLVLPIGMWNANSLGINQQQQQQQTQNINTKNPIFELRNQERKFVISSATNFLLDFFFSKKDSTTSTSSEQQGRWSEKVVIISGKRRSDGLNCSVVLNAAELYQTFWEMNYGGQQNTTNVESVEEAETKSIEKKREEDQTQQEDIDADESAQQFAVFIEGTIREVYRNFTMPSLSNNNKKQLSPEQEEKIRLSSEIFKFAVDQIQPDVRLIEAVNDTSPNGLKCIVQDQYSTTISNSKSKSRIQIQPPQTTTTSSTSSSSSSSSPNEILKWFLRSHDPRAHFGRNPANHGRSGHSNSKFSLLVIHPFLPIVDPVLNAIKKNGFQTISRGVSSENFFEIASNFVLDDTKNRVGIYSNNDEKNGKSAEEEEAEQHHLLGKKIPASAAKKNSLHMHHYFKNEKRPEEIDFLGDGRKDPWTSNDNDGSDSRSVVPFPHLYRRRNFDEKEKQMVGSMRDSYNLREKKDDVVPSAKIYAKSYFCP